MDRRRLARIAALAMLVPGAMALSGCGGDPVAPADEPTATAQALPEPQPSDTGTGAAPPLADDLDAGALRERADPERLLRYYANAVRLGDWDAAARAYALDAQMTGAKLEAMYGGVATPTITIGQGDQEGAAGSIYYEAPIVVDFPDTRPSLRGSIVLRRVNDVPGASAEQLHWRIERTSLVSQ